MKHNRGRIAFAFLLIIIGAWYLAIQLIPGLEQLVIGPGTWPLQIIGLGILFALVAIISWTPALFIPASILTGIGGVLYYQNSTGDWASWSYLWTLIPGFVAFGLLVFGLLTRKRGAYIAGLWNLFGSLLFFGIFGFAFGGINYAAVIWPVALILLGVIVLIMGFRRRKERVTVEEEN